jgi:hypothetical protein
MGMGMGMTGTTVGPCLQKTKKVDDFGTSGGGSHDYTKKKKKKEREREGWGRERGSIQKKRELNTLGKPHIQTPPDSMPCVTHHAPFTPQL